MSILTKEQATIEKLLPDIRATHKEFLKSGQETVELARQIGDMLWKLKECVKHGEWGPLVEQRCEFTIRTATTYMKISGGWELLEKKTAAATTIDGCVKLIGQATPKKSGKKNGVPKSPTSGGSSVQRSKTDSPQTEENAGEDARKEAPGTKPQEQDPRPPRNGTDKPGVSQDYGTCPNCASKKWTADDFGVTCAKCNHPHGEPRGDADEDRAKIMRLKFIKTVEACQRAVDDMNDLVKRPVEHKQGEELTKQLLRLAKGWPT